MKLKLGKLAPKYDKRTLQFSKYLISAHLPPLQTTIDYTNKLPFQNSVFLNNSIGDCTIAAIGASIEIWSSNVGKKIVLPDSAILKAYEAVSGYNPKTGANDNGAVILDVLKYWQKIGVGGHKIKAFVQVNQNNITNVKEAIQLFGNIYVGVALPLSAADQIENGTSWSYVHSKYDNTPYSWGGHCINVSMYKPDCFECITWGQKWCIGSNWWNRYVDECWAVITQDWIEANGRSPGGFNLGQLNADLQQVKQ